MTPAENDVLVFRDDDLATRFFVEPIERIERHIDRAVLHFAGGGHIEIFTDRPWLWVEPDRH